VRFGALKKRFRDNECFVISKMLMASLAGVVRLDDILHTLKMPIRKSLSSLSR